jgi:hypothetical protein
MAHFTRCVQERSLREAIEYFAVFRLLTEVRVYLHGAADRQEHTHDFHCFILISRVLRANNLSG